MSKLIKRAASTSYKSKATRLLLVGCAMVALQLHGCWKHLLLSHGLQLFRPRALDLELSFELLDSLVEHGFTHNLG